MKKLSKRFVSIVLCLTLILTSFPLTALAFNAQAVSVEPGTVTDPGTAYTWETMMGTDADGNRYAGRVWADKSVYKEGDIAVLNTSGDEGSTFNVTLDEDEIFQIVFSALGSSMSSTNTKVSQGPMDVVLILDNSTSMQDVSNGTTRLQKVIESANGLLENLLASKDVRIGITSYNYDADTVLPFGRYTNGVTLSVNNYATGGKISAHDDSDKLLGSDNGYNNGTNTQSGYDRALKMLESATETEGRSPVVILLTDGAANTGVDKSFYDISKGTIRQRFYDSGVPVGIALSTLLNAAYMKASVEDNYNGVSPVVYGIGVDLEKDDGSDAIINPGDVNGFSATNSNANIREAYKLYTDTWCKGETVTVKHTNYSFVLDHNYPRGSAVTDQDIMDNINYVDHYYNVKSEKLEDTFKQIYEEISSGAFNPITSTQKTDGATGVKDTPLIYVDFIGQYMEVKEIQAITLFGSSFGVTKGTEYTATVEGEAVKVTPFTVAAGSGTNPTTNENWSTSDDIKIEIIEHEDGTQKLEVRIDQEILPIILEQLTSKTVGDKTVATIDQFTYNPLRVYYTVGLDSDILLPNGKIDVSKIQGYEYINDNSGTVSFFSNQFGVMNPADGEIVALGDAHIGFQPSEKNRYYYHQSNQGIFTNVETTDNSEIEWDASEYGVLWKDGKYDLTWMSYDEYKNAKDTDEVYTYVTYYHPTSSASDADNAAEEVTYLVYTKWEYLKDSVSFYDNTTKKYVNYNSDTNTFTLDDVGYVVSAEKIAEYVAENPDAELYAVLGVGSRRTSRLHNMTVVKEENTTETANDRYAPEYTSETAKKAHNNNSVVVWLGNNGMHTVEIDTGIALTKNVTEAIGNASDTYALTVTVPAGVEADPVVYDSNGHDVTAAIASYENNVLTVNVKAGETVYVSGISGGTVCTIGELINGDYYVDSVTDTVTVPKVSEVLSGGTQFVAAYVTNAPYKYGDLTIIKDVFHDYDEIPEAMAAKEFTFKIQLPASLAGKTYALDKTNAPAMGDSVTVDDSGAIEVILKDNESVTVMGLPEGTAYTVTEVSNVAGYENATGEIGGFIVPNTDNTAHFVNNYKITPIKPEVIISGNKILVDEADTYTLDEDFTFVLSEYVGVSDANPTGYIVLATDSAKAGESYSFNLASVLTEAHGIGKYYYRVTEQMGQTAGMKYDAQRGLFAVTVTDNDADGTLEYTVEDLANTTVVGNTVTKDFTNIYNVERTHAHVNIIKELKNTTGVNIPKDIFHFTLVNVNDANDVRNATTDASGMATICVNDLAEGTYRYKLTEVKGDLPGMSYDGTEYIVVINVTNEAGTLVATIELEGSSEVNGDFEIDLSFVNEYKLDSVTHTIRGTKELVGREPEDGEFTFELYETDSSFVLHDGVKETVDNVGNSFSFSEITFDKVGTYYYSVKEKAGNAAGVTYDATHYHVTVTVEIDPDDAAKLAVTHVNVNKIGHNSDESAGIVFVNKYAVTPTTYTVSGTKKLIGRAITAGEFKFGLYENGTLIEEASVKADGTFTFSPITYTEAGEHVYTVEEIQGVAPGVIYTGVDNPITVKVTVTDYNSILTASADVANKDINFVNEYVASPTKVTFDGIKTLVGAMLNDGDFTFDLYETDHTFALSGEPLDSVKNENGRFEFEEIEFDKTGIYFFLIEENRNDPIDGIVYDRTQHRFHVQVKDIGYGRLIPTVINLDEGETFTIHSSFDNHLYIDVDFKNATLEEAAEKEVFVKGDTTTEIDGEKVEEGAILTYAITYTNYTGDDVVVDIRDTIPAHTSYVDGSASHNGKYIGSQLHWIVTVGKDEAVTVTFDVQVDETDIIFHNEAHIHDGYNTYTTNRVVNHTYEEPAKKDVFSSEDTSVSIDNKKVYAGDILLYTITYKNVTSEKATVTITDTIPAHITYVEGSADNGGAFADGKVTWEIADIPAWDSVSVSFKVKVDSIGAATIKNKAYVAFGNNTFETNEVSNYTVEDEVKKDVALADKPAVSLDGCKVYAGDVLVYTIVYKNTSPEKAVIEIVDTIPEYTKYVEGTADMGGVYEGGKITWNLEVEAYKTVEVSFAVEVEDVEAATILNTATIVEGKNVYTTNEVTNETEKTHEPDPTPDDEDENETEPKPDPKPDPKPEQGTPSNPQTGDRNVVYLAMLLLISLGGFVTTVSLGKKKKEENC